MTEDDIADLLRSGGIRLAFDTNAVEGDRRRDAVCNKVLQWNRKLSDQHLLPVRLVVCAVAHHEKVFHLKRRFGTTFDPSIIEAGLKSKGLVIEAYDARHALETGAWIGERYPTQSDWHLAKKERSLRSVGLDPSKVTAPGTGHGCGTTVDWLIIGHARAEGCVLVSDDTGPEFTGLIERVKLGTLEAALLKLVSASS